MLLVALIGIGAIGFIAIWQPLSTGEHTVHEMLPIMIPIGLLLVAIVIALILNRTAPANSEGENEQQQNETEDNF